MLAKRLVPTVQTGQRGMKAQRRPDEPFADSHLEIQGDALELVVVCLHLASQVLGCSSQRPSCILVDETESEVNGEGC